MVQDARTAVLGIDIGTSGTKAVVVDETGCVLASSTSNYSMTVPAAGWAEQNPEDWWTATVVTVRDVLDQVKRVCPISIACVGLTGQMHGLVPVGPSGEVIRPAIIWCDVRTEEEVAWLESAIGRETIIGWTQNPPLPNFTLTKLLWMRQHESEAYTKIAKILLPKDYVRYRMTKTYAMDVSDASGTLMLDVANRKWSKEICDAAGVSTQWLPELADSTELVGRIDREFANLTGVLEGTPVVAGAGDQAAGAVGLAVGDTKTLSVVIGTSGVVLAPTDSPVRDPEGRLHTFCHALKDRWFVMGVTQSAGGSLQWYRRRFAQSIEAAAHESGIDVYELLLKEAASAPPGSEGLLFLPYLMGERTPHLDPGARGAWIGLQWRHEAAHLIRAILEGVSFSIKDCSSIIELLGIQKERWRVSGGGAHGPLWMKIFASVIGHPVEVVRAEHGPAYGAAILAAQGVGLLTDSVDGLKKWEEPGRRVFPDDAWTQTYHTLYKSYQYAYQSNRDLMHRLGAL